MADIGGGGEGHHQIGSGLKKLPKPVLIGGAVVVVGGVYYLKKKSAGKATATNANAAAVPVGTTTDTIGPGFSPGSVGTGGGSAGTAGGGSSGVDPNLAAIISSMYPNGVPVGGGAANGVGGGPPVTPVPGVITVGPPTTSPIPQVTPPAVYTPPVTGQVVAVKGNPNPVAVPQTSVGFNASTTPIAVQLAMARAGTISPNQLGPNAKKQFYGSNQYTGRP